MQLQTKQAHFVDSQIWLAEIGTRLWAKLAEQPKPNRLLAAGDYEQVAALVRPTTRMLNLPGGSFRPASYLSNLGFACSRFRRAAESHRNGRRKGGPLTHLAGLVRIGLGGSSMKSISILVVVLSATSFSLRFSDESRGTRINHQGGHGRNGSGCGRSATVSLFVQSHFSAKLHETTCLASKQGYKQLLKAGCCLVRASQQASQLARSLACSACHQVD